MLHAAAMLAGLAVLWMLVTQRASSPQDWAIAVVASLVCVLVAMRFGGATSAFARAPRLLAAECRARGRSCARFAGDIARCDLRRCDDEAGAGARSFARKSFGGPCLIREHDQRDAGDGRG